MIAIASANGAADFEQPGMAPTMPRVATCGRWFVVVILAVFAATLVVDLRIALTLLTLGAFLAAIAGLRFPALGLLGLGVLCTLDAMARPLLLTGGLWRWNTLDYWLLGVAMIFLPLLLRQKDARVHALAALLACLAIGLAWTPDVPNGVQQIFGAMALFGMLVYFLRAARLRHAWYWLAVVNGIAGVASSLAFLRQEPQLPYLNENIWSHAPVLATFSIALAFAAGPLPRRHQLLLAVLASANAGMVFLSGSRGNLAMTLVALATIVLLTPSIGQNLTVLIVSVLFGIGVISQFPDLEARTIGRLEIMVNSQETARRRTSGRFDLALGGWYIFQEHPMGAGTGAFPTRWAQLGRRTGMSSFKVGVPMAAHAGWIKVLAENGVPGILLLTAFVSSFAVSGWRRRAWHLRVLGCATSAVIAIALLSTEFQSKSLWFMAAGATVLLGRPGASPGRRQAPSHRSRQHRRRQPVEHAST
jgi:hypothetical protein